MTKPKPSPKVPAQPPAPPDAELEPDPEPFLAAKLVSPFERHKAKMAARVAKESKT